MGNLHAGHRALIEAACRKADTVIVSIFVNPTQFAPDEDYASYPRTLEQDLETAGTRGASAAFVPEAQEMYPFGTERASTVDVPALSRVLEGASRPGHFRGVASVVARLFNIVAPDVALFGEKDYQQLLVVRRMVRELFMPVDVAGVPTVREPDGLALSSRNAYLTREERRRAPAMHEALQAAAEALRDAAKPAQIERDGLVALKAAGFEPEYFSVRDAATLGAPRPDGEGVILAAGWLGKARLIDNIQLGSTMTASDHPRRRPGGSRGPV
jgi:pantoate--beta-alanine ligase